MKDEKLESEKTNQKKKIIRRLQEGGRGREEDLNMCDGATTEQMRCQVSARLAFPGKAAPRHSHSLAGKFIVPVGILEEYMWEALFSFRPLVALAISFIMIPLLGSISSPKGIFGVTT
ncbi:hypothetical protein E2C01_081086 [Portunus trituberculatus]|uniref:Uncharacterized protein n=1 Tax=Portunus trituberculatus TaxID=210409 RepID=A0A5B7IVB2_PORTR|nr:hypothetical protein [Portunus trituberculatus]